MKPYSPVDDILCKETLEQCDIDVLFGLEVQREMLGEARTTPEGWHLISRVLYPGSGGGSGLVVETLVRRVSSGSLVRCVAYAADNPDDVRDIGVEYVSDTNTPSPAPSASRVAANPHD